MNSAQEVLLRVWVRAKNRLQEMEQDDRGETYAQVIFIVLGVAAAIIIAGILFAKFQDAANNIQTPNAPVAPPAGG
jgi:hypothetical protein